MASGDDEAECPACGRQVYQAEAYLAGTVLWQFQEVEICNFGHFGGPAPEFRFLRKFPI